MEQKQFHELLKEYLDLKGVSMTRLSEASGVPERYLEALLGGDYTRLPARPYVYGYLKKIGPLINVDGEELWRLYERERTPRSSGAADRMPSNRFALKKIKRGWLAGALVLAALLIYLGLRIDTIVGKPSLVIENPPLGELVVTEGSFLIRGVVSRDDMLTLNGEKILVDRDGRFEKEVSLDPGLNVLTFSARRPLGSERTVVRRVIYQPAE